MGHLPSARPPWEGGGNTGHEFDGITHYWIVPQSPASSIADGSYDWIVAQDFNVEQSGWYDFNFKSGGDKELDFSINGSITSYLGDARRPHHDRRVGIDLAVVAAGSKYLIVGIDNSLGLL